jgi:hypothetical protein
MSWTGRRNAAKREAQRALDNSEARAEGWEPGARRERELAGGRSRHQAVAAESEHDPQQGDPEAGS